MSTLKEEHLNILEKVSRRIVALQNLKSVLLDQIKKETGTTSDDFNELYAAIAECSKLDIGFIDKKP